MGAALVVTALMGLAVVVKELPPECAPLRKVVWPSVGTGAGGCTPPGGCPPGGCGGQAV